MINASFLKYKDYDHFVTDFLINVMENDFAVIIVRWEDYQGIIASLNGKLINGKSLALDIECADRFDEDIQTAKDNDGNIMITVFKNAFILGEPVLYSNKAISFVQATHFIEADASKVAMNYAINSTCIPFIIENKIRL